MSQDTLFPRIRRTEDGRAYELPPRTRCTDPASSHEAEQHMRESGKLGYQATQALRLVERYPGKTSKQLALYSNLVPQPPPLDRYQLARRLADLKELGRVRTTGGGKGEGELRWWFVA